MTWAVAIAYGLLAMAGEALHLLPGFEHSSVACSAVESRPAGNEDETDLQRHAHCNHGHVHSQKNFVPCAGNGNDSKTARVTLPHHECQICKLIASLSVCVQPVASTQTQTEFSCPLDSVAIPAQIADVEFGLCIRGPPHA